MLVNSRFKAAILSLVILILVIVNSSERAYAQQVQATLPKFDVTINSVKIDNAKRQYPFLVYKGITYFPMTYSESRFLGLRTHWTKQDGLIVEQTGELMTQYDYSYDKGSQPNKDTVNAAIADFNITVNGKKINNRTEPYPLLIYRDVTYFPITWRFGFEQFGWGYMFDKKTGLTIETKRGYSKYLLSDRNFDAIKIGQSTRADIESLFKQKVTEAERDYNNYIGEQSGVVYRVFSPDQRGSFLFELDLSQPDEAEQVVIGKSMDWSMVYPETLKIINSDAHDKLSKWMTIEAVTTLLGSRGKVVYENENSVMYSHWARDIDGRQASLDLTFKKDKDKQWLISWNYQNEIYLNDVDQSAQANTKFTKAIANKIKIGMTYDELLKVTGYKGYLIKEKASNGQVIERKLMYAGPSLSPYLLIELKSNQITGLEDDPYTWIRP